MHILAHRGVSAHYHENTLLAFEKALEMGVYGIELDLHQIENQFVIFHDFQLDRLAETRADIAELSLAQIAEIRLQKQHKLPILSEVFELVQGKCILNLELKFVMDPSLLIEQVVQYIYQFDAEVVISSFNHPLLLSIQQLLRHTRVAHKVRIGALIAHLPLDMAKYAMLMQADIAAIDAELVSAEFVESAHSYNIEVWCYTVNFERGYRKLAKMKVDAVFSNDPALLSQFGENS